MSPAGFMVPPACLITSCATPSGVGTRRVDSVLVVEDTRSLQQSLLDALSERYPDVRAVRTVAEAIDALTARAPDLVILDFALPDGDARAVLEALHRRGPLPAIVASSGVATP